MPLTRSGLRQLAQSLRPLFGFAICWVLFLVACNNDVAPTTTPITVPAPTGTAPSTVDSGDAIRQVTVFYTNDEHGWMEGAAPGAGAANLATLWQQEETYNPTQTLILSGGDMWTGPAISTWFDGQSMIEVMNGMGYAAAAVGNHEFDFGLDGLKSNALQSQFPLLSANIRYRDDGRTPVDLGIQPYTVIAINDVMIGIIGLTTTLTPFTTHPRNIVDFEFVEYEPALRQAVAQVKAEGAELILVPTHVCQDELLDLAQRIADLSVHMMGGGHCNELFAEEVNGIVVIGGGSHLASYARVAFQFDTEKDRVVDVDFGAQINKDGSPDPEIERIVSGWRQKVEGELNVVIGYHEKGIPRRSQAMQDLITESWLLSYPAADVAMTNLGGMRDALAPGDVSLADITGVMPFNNTIVELRLTGQQLLQVLAVTGRDAAVGGARQRGTRWILKKTGDLIDPEQSYGLLVNDFMYAGGDRYDLLAELDPNAYDTGIDWRQPIIDWVREQNSSAANPLDEVVDQLGSP